MTSFGGGAQNSNGSPEGVKTTDWTGGNLRRVGFAGLAALNLWAYLDLHPRPFTLAVALYLGLMAVMPWERVPVV